MPAKVILEVIQGSMKGRCFEYDSHDVFLLGRRSHCHASIDDDYVSRHQFLMEASPPTVRLMDLGSTHGTIVNDRKYGGREQVDLNNGDRICVGKTELLVRIIEPDADAHVDKIPPAVVGGTLVVPDSPDIPGSPGSPQDEPPQHSNPVKLPSIGSCIQCGHDLYPTDPNYQLDKDPFSDSVCPTCRGTDAVGIKGLFQKARNAWKQFGIGNNWDGYRIESELGRGSMGLVCKARRINDDRIVAIKSMLSKIEVSEKSRRMFCREIDVMRQLRHPNLVDFIETKYSANRFFFVMEYCNGGSLDSLMNKCGGKMDCQTAVPILIQCLEGLRSAHEAKIVHRDLKPANILIHGSDGNWTAKIGDLGMAKNFERAGFSGLSMTGTIGGTLGFMPREQLTNYRKVKPVSDIWSLAATFYNALTGFTPLDFPSRKDEKWLSDYYNAILTNEPVPLRDRDSTIPHGLAQVIDRALSTDPVCRYQSAGEMKADVLRSCSQFVAC